MIKYSQQKIYHYQDWNLLAGPKDGNVNQKYIQKDLLSLAFKQLQNKNIKLQKKSILIKIKCGQLFEEK